MKLKICDLFAGIATASVAADIVWEAENLEHTMVEINPYGRTIIKKHFPNAKLHGDIREYVKILEQESCERKSDESRICKTLENTLMNAKKEESSESVEIAQKNFLYAHVSAKSEGENTAVGDARPKPCEGTEDQTPEEANGCVASPIQTTKTENTKEGTETTRKCDIGEGGYSQGTNTSAENADTTRECASTHITSSHGQNTQIPDSQSLTESHYAKPATSRSTREPTYLVWGSPPCQAASSAGKREGKKDERWLWDEYFRVIELLQPKVVVAENVQGLLSLEGGTVYDSLCSRLESLGYEIGAFLVPASAVGAPHRRNRVWIIGHRIAHPHGLRPQVEGAELEAGGNRPDGENAPHRRNRIWIIGNRIGDSEVRGGQEEPRVQEGEDTDPIGGVGTAGTGNVANSQGVGSQWSEPEGDRRGEPEKKVGNGDSHASGSEQPGLPQREHEGRPRHQEGVSEGSCHYGWKPDGFPDWTADWKRVAAETCARVLPLDDGPPPRLPRPSKCYLLEDGSQISEARNREGALKAIGNGLCLQVVIEIFRAIKAADSVTETK